MNKTLLNSLFIGGILCGLSIAPTNANPTIGDKQAKKPSVEYRCIDRNGTPATVAYTVRGAIELIVWKSQYFSGSGYTPESRCLEVTNRFQQHSDAKNLRYISTGVVNKHNVICVSEDSGNCKSDGLLITLQYDDNPEQVMRELFNLAARKSGGGITRVGSRNRPLKETIDIDRHLAESPIAQDLTTKEAPTTSNTPETAIDNNVDSMGERSVIENPFENY